jgi:SPP1 family predicted phage head-tail adaptor
VQAGKLRNQVVIQGLVNTPDDVGGNIESWVDIGTVWAQVRPLRGKEFWSAQQVNSSLDTVITIRYHENITTVNRIKFGDRIYKIHAVVNPEERREQLQLMCEEVVSSGD